MLFGLKKEGKKYRDDIYPPLQTSIYLNNSLMKNFCEMFQKEGRSIEWMRLSELYKGNKLVLIAEEESQKCLIERGCITKAGGDNDFLAAVFNCLSHKPEFLYRIF